MREKYLERLVYGSWTWEKLTKTEKELFKKGLIKTDLGTKGTETQKEDQIANAYTIFLYAIGYTGWTWREGVK